MSLSLGIGGVRVSDKVQNEGVHEAHQCGCPSFNDSLDIEGFLD